MRQNGLANKFLSGFQRNRLGELLILRGKITPLQLRAALRIQNQTGQTLGTIVRDMNLVSQSELRTTLFEQAAYRAMAAFVSVIIGIMACGSVTTAKASPFNNRDQYTQTAMVQKVAYHPEKKIIAPAMPYPKLFGSTEIASKDTSAFKKWHGLIERMDRIAFNHQRTSKFKNFSEVEQIKAVNDYANQFRYIEDKQNFGQSDYWATPDEFFTRGGDCEDFAIAKYAMLKELGFSKDNMRLAIVQDKIKNIPHAVLIVYTSKGAYVLDNQNKSTKKASEVTRYKPIYSINEQAWWRHQS